MSRSHVVPGTVICLIFVCLQYVYSANILFVAVTPSFSHHRIFQPIWKELSIRGHNVHVVTTDPLKDPSLTNLTEYDISSHYDLIRNASAQFLTSIFKKPDFLSVFVKEVFMSILWYHLSDVTLRHEEMQKLLKKEIVFDVAVIEWLWPTWAALGAKYNCPIVGITSLGAPLVALDTVGNPSHPVAFPDHNLPVTRDMSFSDRLMSALYSVFVRFWHHVVVLPREDKLIKMYLGEDLPYLGDIERNISILLLNRNPVFHRIMPVVPAIVELGAMELNRSRPSLDPELKTFLDKSKQGVIYFNFGSNMQSIYLPDSTTEMFLSVFKQLPYSVVFKWENDSLPGKPDNVFIAKWLPQLTILEHPNTKLFVTQGGLQSSEEAILAEVPIIGFPMASDQTANVDTFVKYGVGIGLDLDYVTAESFKAAIQEIMRKPSYKESARNLAKLIYDRPVDGLKRAVWWIEYVIRHKGARHLRSSILDIPWWQYFMLDIIAFLLAVFSIVFLVLYFVLKGVFLLLRKVIRLVLPKSQTDKKTKRE